MEKKIWLLPVLIVILAACATKSPETVKIESEEKKTEQAPDIVVVEKVLIDVYLLTSEVLKASDGIIDGYVEYEYDVSGNLLTKKELDSEKKLINLQENQVADGKIVRTQWYRGEKKNPGIYIIRKFNGEKLVNETSYDNEDIPQSVSVYEYDGKGNVIRWTVSSGDGVPMMVTEYEYRDGRRVKATFLTPLGDLEGYIEYSWLNGLIESEKTYDKDGDLEKSVLYEYSDGNLVKETYYKKTILDYTIEYELDENGNALNKKHFYRSGNLKAQWDYSYISIKKEVQL